MKNDDALCSLLCLRGIESVTGAQKTFLTQPKRSEKEAFFEGIRIGPRSLRMEFQANNSFYKIT